MTARTTADDVLDWLAARGSAAGLASLGRYGIPQANAFGVAMGVLQAEARRIGPDHDLALALWEHGAYEARTMAVYLAEPARLSVDEADGWCAAFDNWAICDTACFHLFDRTDFAWGRVKVWAADPRLFVRRAGFALIWALSVHDRQAADAAFTGTFGLFAAAAADERPLVRKAVDMALRATGKRNAALNRAACDLARGLACLPGKSSRWIGSHALRELESPTVQDRLVRRAGA